MGELVCTGADGCRANWHRDGCPTNEGLTLPTPTFDLLPAVHLDLADLRATNAARCSRWHGPDTEPWTLADWSNAMCGEAGEAANIVKKIRRIDTGTDQEIVNFPRDDGGAERRRIFVDKLAAELADVVIYADLVASHAGIDLAAAIVRKFNAVSEREGFPERLMGRT